MLWFDIPRQFYPNLVLWW